MPRKSKYHRFRTGKAQKYNKISIKPLRKQTSSLIEFNRNPFYLLFFLSISLTVIILIIPQSVTRDFFHIIFDSVTHVNSYIINVINQTRNEIVSQVLSISYPNFTWQLPEIKLPHLSLKPKALSIPDLTYFTHLAKSVFHTLNPIPVANLIYEYIKLVQYYNLIYAIKITEVTLRLLIFINPQSLLSSLHTYFIIGLQTTFTMLLKIASFVNPYPAMSKTIEIELNMLSLLTKFILFGFEFLGVSIYTILSIFINSSLRMLQIAWSAVVLILSSILNFFLSIYTKIAQVFNLIYLKIQYFAHLTEPYTSYIAETFNRIISNFAKSANDLKNTSASIVDQYNSYHPK